jgi:hypothetical protein
MCKELYRLGFDDTEDLYNIMNIPLMDSKLEKAKKVYYLERMGEIYWNMTHGSPHGVKRLMDIFRKKQQKITVFGKQRREVPKDVDIHAEIDRRLK